MFIDYSKIYVKAGDGGDGAVAFRREKFVPKGGPAGGDGGRGGNVIFVPDSNLFTLLDFRYNKKYMAEDGKPGGTSQKDGRNGEDIIIRIPPGTLVKNYETKELICDCSEVGKEYFIVRGGNGGRGNSKFATSINQAPRSAELGRPGMGMEIELELKLIADVGLVGFPNAGKSTLISVISAAKPKIADYPFTTLKPNLGIVNYKEYKSFTVADIPGIIEGAHLGKGLGHQFLRHIERTKILLLLIDVYTEDVQEQYDTLLKELENYSPVLAAKKKLLAFSKSDLLTEEDLAEFKEKKIAGYDGPIFIFSAMSREGLQPILDFLWEQLV